jgi:hypothetical protein
MAKERGLTKYSTLLKSDLIYLLERDDRGKRIVAKSKVAKLPSPPKPKSKATKPKATKAKRTSVAPVTIVEPRMIAREIRETFQITPSLAFIYQLTNPENKGYLPDKFTIPDFVFTYEDAKECSQSITSKKWKLVEKYIDIFEKDVHKNLRDYLKGEKFDKAFLLDLLKKEVLELQKGNITLLHAKNLQYLVLDIISQLISGSYEGFKPKCLRKEDEIEKTALDIIKKLFQLPKVAKSYSKDHEPEIRKRVISVNTTIFNNAFYLGESTLGFFYYGSVLEPSEMIKYLKLDDKMEKFVSDLMNKIIKIGKHLIMMYSIPLDKIQTYIYPSKAFGEIDKQPNIYKNYNSYLSEEPWKSKFNYQYQKQYRIVDLCYTKYGYKDGIRIYQLTDIPVDKLEEFVKKIDRKLSKEKEISDWFVNYIDIAEKKRPKPLRSIRFFKSGKLLQPSESTMMTMESKSRSSRSTRDTAVRGSKRDPIVISDDEMDRRTDEPEIIIRRGERPIPERDMVIRPAEIDYESKTVIQLKEIAKSRGLKKYSALRKADLIELLKKH